MPILRHVNLLSDMQLIAWVVLGITLEMLIQKKTEYVFSLIYFYILLKHE